MRIYVIKVIASERASSLSGRASLPCVPSRQSSGQPTREVKIAITGREGPRPAARSSSCVQNGHWNSPRQADRPGQPQHAQAQEDTHRRRGVYNCEATARLLSEAEAP